MATRAGLGSKRGGKHVVRYLDGLAPVFWPFFCSLLWKPSLTGAGLKYLVEKHARRAGLSVGGLGCLVYYITVSIGTEHKVPLLHVMWCIYEAMKKHSLNPKCVSAVGIRSGFLCLLGH